MSDWNDKIIDEFRANGGQVGGQFAGTPLLLLHTIGAKSGQPRVNRMVYADLPPDAQMDTADHQPSVQLTRLTKNPDLPRVARSAVSRGDLAPTTGHLAVAGRSR